MDDPLIHVLLDRQCRYLRIVDILTRINFENTAVRSERFERMHRPTTHRILLPLLLAERERLHDEIGAIIRSMT